jgi:hypothetical protein
MLRKWIATGMFVIVEGLGNALSSKSARPPMTDFAAPHFRTLTVQRRTFSSPATHPAYVHNPSPAMTEGQAS